MSGEEMKWVLRRAFDRRWNAEAIDPSQIALMDRREIGSLPLKSETGSSRLSDWFDLIGDPSDCISLEGDCGRLDRLGAHMRGGTLRVLGDAGDEAASQMNSGTLEIAGNCGNRLGQGMLDGMVLVRGNAGDHLGCPLPGDKRGISGGEIMIAGSVGDEACQRMRRGLVLIGKDAGVRLASNMIAGSIMVAGVMGADWGSGMRRGSLLLLRDPQEPPQADLTNGRRLELSFLPLLWNRARLLATRFQLDIQIPTSRWAVRRIGDRAVDGHAEILVIDE